MKRITIIIFTTLSIYAFGQSKSYLNDSPEYVKKCILNSREYVISIVGKETFLNNFVLDSTFSFGELSKLQGVKKYDWGEWLYLRYNITIKGKLIKEFSAKFDTTGQVLASDKVVCDSILKGYKMFLNNEFKVNYISILKFLKENKIQYDNLEIDIINMYANNNVFVLYDKPTDNPDYEFLRKVKRNYYYELNIDKTTTIVLLDTDNIKNYKIETGISQIKLE